MTIREKFVLELLEKMEFRHLEGSYPFPTKKKFFEKYEKEIEEVYQSLGGQSEIEIAEPDLSFEFENFTIKLDEADAFNHYRLTTFQSPIYGEWKNFNVESYKRFCRQYEHECLKAAGFAAKWTNLLAEKHFGVPGPVGELDRKGSPAWKASAFKAFLTDLSSKITGKKVIRIPMYENLMVNQKLIRLDSLLMTRQPASIETLNKYLTRITAEFKPKKNEPEIGS